jgi:hypothetical protein
VNISKEKIPCQPVIGGVETMNDKELTKYIVAFTYGDGSIGYHGKNCRFGATCIIDNMDYILWRKSILENLTPVLVYENSKDLPNHKRIFKTNSRTHPTYTKIQNRMYHDGRKTIDPHYLKLMDWETLAIFYMDDGSLRNVTQTYKENTYSNKYPNIASMSFNYAENLMLRNCFKDILGIEFNIHKHSTRENGEINYMLCLGGSSRERFYKGIGKYILPSFRYKLDNSYDVPPYQGGEDIVRTTEKSVEEGANDLLQEEILE